MLYIELGMFFFLGYFFFRIISLKIKLYKHRSKEEGNGKNRNKLLLLGNLFFWFLPILEYQKVMDLKYQEIVKKINFSILIFVLLCILYIIIENILY